MCLKSHLQRPFCFIVSFPEVLVVKRGRNMDWGATGRYAGASINILVNCDREKFIADHPEYHGEPYVIVNCPTGKFREQVANGQAIFCTDECHFLPEEVESGIVGYWVPEMNVDSHEFGITAFHVLDYVTEYSGMDNTFLSHENNCCEHVLTNQSYQLGDRTSHGLKCSYVCGLYDNSFDVGVVRCTGQDKKDMKECQSTEDESLASGGRMNDDLFQWPEIFHKMIIEKEIELTDFLLDYELRYLNEHKLSIFHNGKSSRRERKIGELTRDFPVVPLGDDKEGKPIYLGDTVVIVEGAVADADELFCVRVDLLEKVYSEVYERIVESDQSSPNSSNHGSDSESDCSYEHHNGNDTNTELGRASSFKYKHSVNDDIGNKTSNVGENTECRTTADVEQILNARCDIVDADIVQDGSNSKEEEDSWVENQDVRQKFTLGGDSGCIYFIRIEMDDQLLKAPIGIHRGAYEDSEDQPKNYSCASPIGSSLQKLKKKYGLDLWFRIGRYAPEKPIA